MQRYLFVLLALALAACAQETIVPTEDYACTLSFADASGQHADRDAFTAELAYFAARTPGIQIAITSQNGQSWTGASGWADLANRVPFEPCTKTMIGSISKVMTGVLILQLQEEGKLSLDDPLSRHLEASVIGEIANADQVNLRHLLQHTSGIKDYLGLKQFVNSVNTPYLLETQEEKLRYIYGKPADHAPDAQHTYSNTNYVLLGLIVEKLRDMPLWEAVDQFIAAPLGLRNMVMGTHEVPIPVGTARPYLASRGDKYQDIMPHAVADAATGDGGIASNMQDVNAFFQALFAGEVVDPATLEAMVTDRVSVGDMSTYDFGDEWYGLGIEIYTTPHGIAYGHTGSTSTYGAYTLHFPQDGVTISMAFNGYNFREEPSRFDLMLRLLDRTMGQ
ncbi:MAG: serine hydrolase domain-containing protein [Bacteroidota bacterium]